MNVTRVTGYAIRRNFPIMRPRYCRESEVSTITSLLKFFL